MEFETIINLMAILFLLSLIVMPFVIARKICNRVAEKECMICHQLTRGKTQVKGSFIIEIFLWFFFLIPGLIYSMWRISSSEVVCNHCGNKFLKVLSKSDLQEIKKCRKKTA